MEGRTPLETEPYKGVRDFYPEDWARLQSAFQTIRTVLKLRGFEEYNASPLERAEIYEQKTSEEIVSEQTYTFTDRGDRKVTLRPEMTPTLARMVAARRRELVFPLRWFSIPNVFRYERPQRGRLREHYQLNVDILGIDSLRADGEAIVVAHELLTALGAKNRDFVIKIGSRTLLTTACKAAGFTSDEDIKSYSRLLDRKAKMPAEEFEAALTGRPDPFVFITQGGDAEVDTEKKKVLDLIDAFKARGIDNVEFDPEVVRGFDYYTGVVFEVFDTDPKNNRSMFGGGRYDNLVGMFGGDPVPAVGFGMGDVTLFDFLETHNLLPKVSSAALLYLGTPTEADIGAAQALGDTLRQEGVSVLVNTTTRALGDQIKEAVRRGIPYFIAYGSNEASSKKVKLKTLATSNERTIEKKKIAKTILG